MGVLGALSTSISPVYVGINNGDHETDAFSLTDRKLVFCYAYASMSIRASVVTTSMTCALRLV